jgi:phosphoribosylanthranilate isomerase
VADPVRVKICGICSREDVLVADAAGADYVGLVLTHGFGRSVAPTAAPALVEGVSASVVSVLVDEPLSTAVRLARLVGASVVQLHGSEEVAVAQAMAREGDWKVWKAVRARAPRDLLSAVQRYGDVVDGILLEGVRPGVVGGGGAKLDLDVFADACRQVPAAVDLVLAGGLTPDSVEAAVARIAPDVVDVSSGVELEPGRKAPELVRRFIDNARRTWARAREDRMPETEGRDS